MLSSRIEGTQATLGELLASDAGTIVQQSLDDLREVANYVVALEHGLGRQEFIPRPTQMMKNVLRTSLRKLLTFKVQISHLLTL